MTKQLLFYERAMPVSQERHRDWSLEARKSFTFAAHSNVVPIVAAEFPATAQDYAIVFAATGEQVAPVVVFGLKPDENLFIDDAGKWTGNYVPAFIRRYPFVFSKSPDGTKFILCIDEAADGWNQSGNGQALFEDGQQSEFLRNMMRFVAEYQGASNATSAFCRQLQDLELLDPMAARFKLPSGQDAQLAGFRAVNREKLKALSAEKLSELAKNDALELIYAHLLSLRNIGVMLARLKGEVTPQPDDWWEAIKPEDTTH